MARRNQGGLAEAVMELFTLMPWWVGVIAAPLFYLLLHPVATQAVPAATEVGQYGAMATRTLWKTFALFGQYLLPFLSLMGAAISAWRRRQRSRLAAEVAQNPSADALDGMSWREFEMLVGEGFRLQGFRVVETGGGGADGGVDLVLSRPGQNGSEKYLVQCKQWRAYKVGVDVVRELYGVMAARGAAGGFVVTSGRFTDEARRFASGRNVELVDGPRLRQLIQKARGGGAQPARQEPALQTPAAPVASAPVQRDGDERPNCPVCGKRMVRRVAKRGASAGAAFWGCVDYPGCKGTRGMG
ncbi:restriction endonuclease [Rubrivivax benzoatilyticus]|uniref:Restriction endonuclease n=1 Tax=Rubrivivax benzoatilyticus TaxID=316997 RepID=A0ABX0I3X6_9BURK|nr:restriction endonuclease [Rubrivivax benzoatilyticus]EGJ09365.1 restriction endonuclease [Rubrivivax benzoatilyticus JA2 = ATCC BAA-35]NHL00497.1 restriction endonuclease [Rubrivivax benzoatilyticus]NHL26362.1 restriction endonuclease [Rubrivivax benzoatilyticus]